MSKNGLLHEAVLKAKRDTDILTTIEKAKAEFYAWLEYPYPMPQKMREIIKKYFGDKK